METLDKRQKWSQEQTISGKASVVRVNGTAGGGGGGGGGGGAGGGGGGGGGGS